MELKPRSDGGQAKASLPEKKKSSQDDRAAQSAAKRMSLLLNLYRLQGLPEAPCGANGGIAQLGERLLCTQEASGSSPLISIIWVASSVG